MNTVDKQIALERYNSRLEEFGYDAKTLGWGGGRERQDVRFKTLLDIAHYIEIPVQSVLDVGCGFADMYDYIQKQSLPIAYQGIDINPLLLEKAQEIYPKVNVATTDILEDANLTGADIVVESGIFNYQLSGEDQWDYIVSMLRQMFALSRYGVAADFMTTHVDWQKEGAFHADPGKLLQLARAISAKAILRHDYLPYEFCLYLLK